MKLNSLSAIAPRHGAEVIEDEEGGEGGEGGSEITPSSPSSPPVRDNKVSG